MNGLSHQQSPIKAAVDIQPIKFISRPKKDKTALPSLKVTQTDPSSYRSKYKVVQSEKPKFRNQLMY